MTYAAAVERLRAIAHASLQITLRLPEGVPNVAAVRVRLAEGIPALCGEPLIDWRTLAQHVAAFGASIADTAPTLRTAVLDAALGGSLDELAAYVPPETLTLVDYAARPALRAGCAATRSAIDAAQWDRGRCPACGALPLLAELGAESRTMRCARCSAAWSFARIACPACGERDHRQLRYLHVDGEVTHRRASCCATCAFYVKEIATLDTLGDAALFKMDLDTLGLDAIAVSAGYKHDG